MKRCVNCLNSDDIFTLNNLLTLKKKERTGQTLLINVDIAVCRVENLHKQQTKTKCSEQEHAREQRRILAPVN